MDQHQIPKEIEAASIWWTSQIERHIPKSKADKFKTLLQHHLLQKISGHWYEHDPLRGSGYRSILVDELQTDRTLLRVALECGDDVYRVVKKILPKRPVVMWINPGYVSVRMDGFHTFPVYTRQSDVNRQQCVQS